MRIKDANYLQKQLAKFPHSENSAFGMIIAVINKMPEIEVVPLEEHEALVQRCRELEKQLSDVGSSPFDGGMSQAEYFDGERRGGWSWPTGHDNRHTGATCGACNRFVKQPGTLWIYCPLCGARNGYQPVDAKRSFNPPVGGGGEDG